MNCKTCRKALQPEWQFCPQCGQKSEIAEPGSQQKEPMYGTAVRQQVFEVIVRQAIAGAPWRLICKGPMMINKITEAEIEAEVARRNGNQQPSGTEQPLDQARVKACEEKEEEELDTWINDLLNNAVDKTLSGKIKSVIERLKELTDLRDNEKQALNGKINKLLDLLNILMDEARRYERMSREETERLLDQLKNELDDSKEEPRRKDLPGH